MPLCLHMSKDGSAGVGGGGRQQGTRRGTDPGVAKRPLSLRI